jgi:hypothetical protein
MARQTLAVSLLGATLAAGVFVLTACEDKAIGRRCDLQADAGAQQAGYNGQALECPTRICVKPAYEQGVADKQTAPYCTAECSKDSDCDGETRDSKNGADRRCTTGFMCGIAFEVGPLCCKKLCLCKDFIPKEGLPPRTSCDKGKGGTCQNL